jgi:hypothetical protein
VAVARRHLVSCLSFERDGRAGAGRGNVSAWTAVAPDIPPVRGVPSDSSSCWLEAGLVMAPVSDLRKPRSPALSASLARISSWNRAVSARSATDVYLSASLMHVSDVAPFRDIADVDQSC